MDLDLNDFNIPGDFNLDDINMDDLPGDNNVDPLPGHSYFTFTGDARSQKRCDKLRKMAVGSQLYIDWDFLESIGEKDRLHLLLVTTLRGLVYSICQKTRHTENSQ